MSERVSPFSSYRFDTRERIESDQEEITASCSRIEGTKLEHFVFEKLRKKKGETICNFPAFIVSKQEVKPDKFPLFPFYLGSIMS